MNKKQLYTPIVRGLKHFEAPNRKTFRALQKMKRSGKLDDTTFERITQTTYTNPEREFKEFRSELARNWGSKTGKLKKKHINKQRSFDLLGEATK